MIFLRGIVRFWKVTEFSRQYLSVNFDFVFNGSLYYEQHVSQTSKPVCTEIIDVSATPFADFWRTSIKRPLAIPLRVAA